MIQSFVDTWNKYRHEVRAEIARRGWVDMQTLVESVFNMLLAHKEESRLSWHAVEVIRAFRGDTYTFLIDTPYDDDVSPGYAIRFSSEAELVKNVRSLEDTTVEHFTKFDLDVCMEFARRVICELRVIPTLTEPGYIVRKKQGPANSPSYYYLDLSSDCYSKQPAAATTFSTYADARRQFTSDYIQVVDNMGCEEVLR